MLKTIELQLDEETLARAQHLAHQRRSSIEKVLAKLIEYLASLDQQDDPLLGMFADEPEVMDQVTELTMLGREAHPLRVNDG